MSELRARMRRQGYERTYLQTLEVGSTGHQVCDEKAQKPRSVRQGRIIHPQKVRVELHA